MISLQGNERKSAATVVLKKIHPSDLLQREERIAADSDTLIDMGIGADAMAFIQTPADLERFLDLAEEAAEGLHLLQLETGEELFLHRRGKFAELCGARDLARLWGDEAAGQAIAELRQAAAVGGEQGS
jgi:hypothetical protein